MSDPLRPALDQLIAQWRAEVARMKANDHKFPDRFAVARCADELAALLIAHGGAAQEAGADLDALIARWREEAAKWLHGIGDNQNTRLLTECADELEASLRSIYNADREGRTFLSGLLDPDNPATPVEQVLAFLCLWANSYLLKGNYWDVPQTMGAALNQAIPILKAALLTRRDQPEHLQELIEKWRGIIAQNEAEQHEMVVIIQRPFLEDLEKLATGRDAPQEPQALLQRIHDIVKQFDVADRKTSKNRRLVAVLNALDSLGRDADHGTGWQP